MQKQGKIKRPKFQAPPSTDNHISYKKLFPDKNKFLAKGNPSFKELRQNIHTLKELNKESCKSLGSAAGDIHHLRDGGVHRHELKPKMRPCCRGIEDKKALVDLDFKNFIDTQNIKIGQS